MIPEKKAEEIAEKAANKEKFPQPALTMRALKGREWHIEFESRFDTESFILVKIDAESGKVIGIEKGRREDEAPKLGSVLEDE
ncbi:MAG: PepSY domain-containing protein [Candidatus Aenigmarchaeota archaeon]|nr:PepSY domain-containing protein [Candidatus Aenigmarchaeota archaeon]